MLPGQMSPGQMSPGQMSPGQTSPGQMSPGQISGEQLESVLDVLWNLRLKVWSKFGSVTAKILLTLSLLWWWVVVKSFSHKTQPLV